MLRDEEGPLRKIAHEIGQDLSILSIEELAARIALLNAEIARLDSARTAKLAQRQAADALFKSR